MTHLIVIGGGPAGVTAALRARELGASVTLVERASLGGTCTNDGCIPTRVLAKAARLKRDAHQYPDYGLSPAEPEVDLGQVLSRAQHIVYQIHEKKQLINSLQEAGVTVYTDTGTARFVDPHTLELGSGARLKGEKFILAVGGHARRLNFPGAEHALTHSDVWMLKKLPESVAIIGAAATGCQLGSVFNDFGARVTLLDTLPRILAQEDESLSEEMARAFTGRGIQIIAPIQGVERIEMEAHGLSLYYRRADQVQRLEAAAVIQAVGWPGNVDELNLAAAGVHTDGRYIQVDDSFCTSASHIYAAGDITGRMMLVQSAGYEARLAVENALLGECRSTAHQVVPHGGFTDPEYGSVGLTEAQARRVGQVLAATARFSEMDRAVIDGRPEGFCKLVISPESHLLLGAHVVGEQALEIVHVVAAGMAAGMRVEQLAALEIAYPTYTAIVGLVARRLAHELGEIELSPQWRLLGRPHTAEWEQRDPSQG